MTGSAAPEPLCCESRSGGELARWVRNQLGTHGYVHLPALTEMRFLQLAGALGPILGRLDVRLEHGHSLLSSAKPMPFHTDVPEAEMIGWWCAEPAERDGENLLIDTTGIADHLSSADLDELTRTYICLPLEGERAELHPCLALRDGRYRIYYAPWQMLPSYEPAQRGALDALRAYLRSQRPFVVPLRRAESLFIDNGRFLHGRAALLPDSRRHLRRLWIGRQISDSTLASDAVV
ncbi:MAG: TauD/TfdA family dioxygenase [Bryobacteraceae bacterium]